MSDENVGGLVELLPCPFCGSGAEFVAYKRDGLTIRCKALGCVSRNQRAIRLSIDQLREAMANNWNTRVSAHGQPPPRVTQEMANSLHETAQLLDEVDRRSEARREAYGLHGQPVVDEAMVARAEAYTTRVLPGRSTACLGGQFNFWDLLTTALTGDKE